MRFCSRWEVCESCDLPLRMMDIFFRSGKEASCRKRSSSSTRNRYVETSTSLAIYWTGVGSECVCDVLCVAAEDAETKTKKNEKKEKRKAAFGWDVFNQVCTTMTATTDDHRDVFPCGLTPALPALGFAVQRVQEASCKFADKRRRKQ